MRGFGIKENQIVLVLANETGDVRTEPNNTETLLTGEIERKPRKFCRQPLAFERLWHFGVKQYDAVGRKAIGEQGAKSVDVQLESVRFFVVRYGDAIQVHVHGFAHWASE